MRTYVLWSRLLGPLEGQTRGVFSVAAYAGLRAGEIAALDWQGVDLTANTITVSKSYDWKSKSFGPPKSEAGRRTVPVAPEFRAELRAHMRASGRRTGLVFGKNGVTQFHDSTVTRSAQKTWSECDPPMAGLGLHEFRHTAITTWIEAGVNPKRVSRWAGHADVALTLRVYAKAFVAQEPDEAAKVASYLQAAKQPKNEQPTGTTGAHPLQSGKPPCKSQGRSFKPASLRNSSWNVRGHSDVFSNTMETRTLAQIKRELDAATTLRAELWHELSRAADSAKAAEIASLNERIEALWSEARAAQNRERFGSQAEIQKRARAEERLERDLRRVA